MVCLAVLMGLMYLEGLLFSGVVINFAPIERKWLKFLIVSIWPVAIPYLVYKIYATYAVLISQFKNNPLFSMMLNQGETKNGGANPLPLDLLQDVLTTEDFEPDVDSKETQGN